MNTALIILSEPGAGKPAKLDRHDSMSEALAEVRAMAAVGMLPRSWVAAGQRGDGSAVVEGDFAEIGRLAYSITRNPPETHWRIKPSGLGW